MRKALLVLALAGIALPSWQTEARPLHHHAHHPRVVYGSDALPLSNRPSDYSNGHGTNAANSYAVGRPVGPYGGYVVNEYGFGNYVSGPAGYGGYPAGSAAAQIWRQRERWKCEAVPETC